MRRAFSVGRSVGLTTPGCIREGRPGPVSGGTGHQPRVPCLVGGSGSRPRQLSASQGSDDESHRRGSANGGPTRRQLVWEGRRRRASAVFGARISGCWLLPASPVPHAHSAGRREKRDARHGALRAVPSAVARPDRVGLRWGWKYKSEVEAVPDPVRGVGGPMCACAGQSCAVPCHVPTPARWTQSRYWRS